MVSVFEAQEDAEQCQSGPGWSGQVYGACPVQGIGKVGDDRWYFRARHGDWSLQIWRGSGDVPALDEYPSAEWWGDDPSDGWMPYSKVWAIVRARLTEYLGGKGREVRIAVHEDGVRYRLVRHGVEVIDAVAPTAVEALRIGSFAGLE